MPSATQWYSNYAHIRRLYIDEDRPLEGAAGVRTLMQQQFGFSATKLQYTRQFSRWKWRKHHTSEEWKALSVMLRNWKAQDLQSAVYFNGKLIPDHVVRKETGRHDIPSHTTQTVVPVLPKGFYVTWPSVGASINWAARSPFAYAHGILSTHSMFRILENPREDASHTPFNFLQPLHSTSESLIDEDGRPKGSSMFEALAPRSVWEKSLPTSLFHNQGPKGSILIQFQTIIYAISNGYAGFGAQSSEDVWNNLKSLLREHTTRLLELIPGRTGEALREKLFQGAIEAGDTRSVEWFIKSPMSHIDVNQHICIEGNRRYTPLELSCLFDQAEIMRLFIKNGADLHKTYEPNPDLLRSKCGLLPCIQTCSQLLSIAVTRYIYPDGLNLELIKTLLETGSLVTCHSFKLALKGLSSGDVGALRLLLATGDLRHHDWVTLIDQSCYEDMNEAQLNEFILFLLDFIQEPMASRCPKTDILSQLHDFAIQKEFWGPATKLVKYGAALNNRTLINAIKSQNQRLDRFLMEAGANKYAVAYAAGKPVTPLSEAIRTKSQDLVQPFLETNSFDDTQAQLKMRAALIAASDIGDLALFDAFWNEEVKHRLDILDECLEHAVKKNHDLMAFTLMGFGASMPILDCPTMSAALKNKNSALVHALIQSKAIDKAASFRCPSPIWDDAIDWGNLSIIQELIQAGLSLEVDPEQGLNPLILAVRKKNPVLVKFFLEAGARAPEFAGPLVEAAFLGDISMVKLLLSAGLSSCDSLALYVAVYRNDNKLLDVFLREFRRVYPSGVASYGAEALHYAIRKCNFELVAVLLQHNVDYKRIVHCYNYLDGWIDEQTATDDEGERDQPDNKIEERGSEESQKVKTYWQAGTDIYEQSALAVAMQCPQYARSAMVSLLIEWGTDPNSIVGRSQKLAMSYTAVLFAIKLRDLSTLRLLVESGANINYDLKASAKRTPLQQAAEIGAKDIVEYLLNCGAIVDATPAYAGGGTALQLASIGGYTGIVELLLTHFANVNAAPSVIHGRSCLEGAAEHGRLDTVQMLLDAGARIDGPDFKRAKQYALNNGHQVVARLLDSFAQEHVFQQMS